MLDPISFASIQSKGVGIAFKPEPESDAQNQTRSLVGGNCSTVIRQPRRLKSNTSPGVLWNCSFSHHQSQAWDRITT